VSPDKYKNRYDSEQGEISRKVSNANSEDYDSSQSSNTSIRGKISAVHIPRAGKTSC
jgi:hypothetical protein